MPTLYDAVEAWADQWPDKLAIITEEDGDRTFGQLAEAAGRFGHALAHDLGLPVGGRAAQWLTNRPEWLEASVGMHAAGVASVPSNPDWSDTELGYVLEHAGCRVLVCDAERAERALALRDRVGCLEHVVVVDDDAVPGARSFAELLAGAPASYRDGLPRLDAPPTGSILYTSGTTTGRPKGVAMSAELLTSGVSYEEMFDLGHTDRSIVVTPLFHGNGLGGTTSAISRGGSTVFPRKFSAHRFWSLVDRYRPTYLFTLAPIVNILMSLPPSPLERSHNLRVLIVLGAAANMEAIEERFGTPVIDWYGMTEAGTGTYTRLGEKRPAGSAGRVFEGSEMRILLEDGTVAKPGEVGEVAFKSTAVGFTGYLEDEEATTNALKDGWFLTGDLGRIDEDGFFYFVDRKKDIVRRGGENISSIEVEAALRTHPAIADAAVLGRPDPVLGERVVAFVVPAEGATLPSPDELRTHCAPLLAPFKIPEELLPIDVLPRTGTGKIEKFRLRQRLAG